MDTVLVPGLWLNASTWDRVTPALEAAGHRTHALTLPGMGSAGSDRTGITAADHVDAVVTAIDAAAGPVLLVAHSAGCGIAHAALDARPDRVVHVVHIGGFPGEDGDTLLSGLPAEDGEVAMPDWVQAGEPGMVSDFRPDALAAFYAAAIPVPEAVITTPVPLRDERRYEVPVTAVCPGGEYSADQLRAWVADGDLPELARVRTVTYVDIDSGHWPQLTRPDELAQIILHAVPAPG